MSYLSEDENSENSSNDSFDSESKIENWIKYFCEKKGNEFFCEVDIKFIENESNLLGLPQFVKNFDIALKVVMNEFDLTDLNDEQRKEAERLYGLLHYKYIRTASGLKMMFNKFKNQEFGTCPRYHCEFQATLPMGEYDELEKSFVKIYCPKCKEMFHPPSTRRKGIDGAYFGRSFPHLFLRQYPSQIPTPPATHYFPRVFGFAVYKGSHHLLKDYLESRSPTDSFTYMDLKKQRQPQRLQGYTFAHSLQPREYRLRRFVEGEGVESGDVEQTPKQRSRRRMRSVEEGAEGKDGGGGAKKYSRSTNSGVGANTNSRDSNRQPHQQQQQQQQGRNVIPAHVQLAPKAQQYLRNLAASHNYPYRSSPSSSSSSSSSSFSSSSYCPSASPSFPSSSYPSSSSYSSPATPASASVSSSSYSHGSSNNNNTNFGNNNLSISNSRSTGYGGHSCTPHRTSSCNSPSSSSSSYSSVPIPTPTSTRTYPPFLSSPHSSSFSSSPSSSPPPSPSPSPPSSTLFQQFSSVSPHFTGRMAGVGAGAGAVLGTRKGTGTGTGTVVNTRARTNTGMGGRGLEVGVSPYEYMARPRGGSGTGMFPSSSSSPSSSPSDY